MLDVDIALKKILESATAITEIEHCPLNKAMACLLAQDQFSGVNVPPADNSAMDGYALNIDDLKGNQNTLPISQTITAGSAPAPLTKGTAARIFTGAEIPSGANAVVMQEQCEQQANQVTFPDHIPLHNNIRPIGQDIQQGEKILSQGTRLQAQHIGLLASVGIAQVPVYRKLRVAILSTGSELVEPGQTLAPGKIYNSNRYLLLGMLEDLGVEAKDLGVVEDNLQATQEKLLEAADADLIITTGGVSVGDEDHVKNAIKALGELDLWRLALKPGKPLALGRIGQTPLFGLPGNPVSTFVTFLLFVRPFIQIQQGGQYSAPQSLALTARFNTKANPKRQEYLRVKISQGQASPYKNQSSGVLSSVVWADGLAIVPKGTAVNEGDLIEVIPFTHF